MLIIFDLDDTLVQTTRTLTPHLLKQAVCRMVEEGLDVSDVEDAIKQLQRIDTESRSSRESLKKFLEKCRGGEKFFEIGLKEIYENVSLTFPLEPMESAKEILCLLRESHLLAIVTAGIDERQRVKMEKAGIEPYLFSKIIVCGKTEKRVHYQQLAKELRIAAPQVVVCGDRIDTDLVPAKELGFTTIHMRQGRGRCEPKHHEAVDFSICQLSEIEELLCHKL